MLAAVVVCPTSFVLLWLVVIARRGVVASRLWRIEDTRGP